MARLGEALGWGGNPFYDTLSSNRNVLANFGAGLASGANFGEGVANGLAGVPQGMARDDAAAALAAEKAQQQATLNQTTEWLRQNGQSQLLAAVESGAMEPGQAFQMAISQQQAQSEGVKPIEINGQLVDPSTGQVIGDYRDAAAMGGGSTEYGLTPIWGQMPDGTFGYGVQGKDGTFRQVDTGTLNPLDPRSLAGERAFGAAVGGAQGQGAAAASGDVSTATTALNLLDQIETSPELPYATGTSAGLGGNKIPGTGRYGFQNLVDQAKSGAFLSAIQQMRGMGALSNAEGQVATSAITRMDTALSEADFKKALADYRAVINTGLERATGRIGMQPNMNAPRGASPTGQTSTGLSWSVTP